MQDTRQEAGLDNLGFELTPLGLETVAAKGTIILSIAAKDASKLALQKLVKALTLARDKLNSARKFGVNDGAKGVERASTLKPGPYGKQSIPGHPGKPTAEEQRKINDLFNKNGCHTCGTTNPGTKSGNAIVDHQPAQALGETTEFYPHCIDCMRRQGGEVLKEIIRRGRNE